MSNVVDKPLAPSPQPEAVLHGVDDVLDCLVAFMKPRQVEKARRHLEAHLERLERHDRLARVTAIRSPAVGSDKAEAAFTRAATVRTLIGRAF